jgi:hypothetical protein
MYATDAFTNWPSSTSRTNWVMSGPQQNVFLPLPLGSCCASGPAVTGSYLDTPLTTPARFFRAVDGKDVCKSNLRKILWAKEQWALDNGQAFLATPNPELYLFGPTNYLPEPFCPNGGVYTMNSMHALPTCNIGLHTFP